MYVTFVCMVLLGLVGVVHMEDCPSGDWKKFKDNCYLFVTDEKDHAQAKANCEAKGGYLAEIRTDDEDNFVLSNAAARSYIGYVDHEVENKFVGGYSNIPMTYSNWRKNEPNNFKKNSNDKVGEDCVEINYPNKDEKKWNDIFCDRKLASVCEYKLCPNGWKRFSNDKCYFFESEKKDQEHAKANCKDKGGYLAEIRTDEENKFVSTNAAARSYIGYVDDKKEGHFVGGHSNKPVTYSHWRTGEPNNVKKNNMDEDCVEINYPNKNTQWNDIFCNTKLTSVCEYNLKG